MSLLYLFDSVMFLVTLALILPIPGFVITMQREVSKVAYIISKITKTATKILVNISQVMVN